MNEITDHEMLFSIKFFMQNKPLFIMSLYDNVQVTRAYESGIPNLIMIEMVINQQYPMKAFLVSTGNKSGSTHTFLDIVLVDSISMFQWMLTATDRQFDEKARKIDWRWMLP